MHGSDNDDVQQQDPQALDQASEHVSGTNHHSHGGHDHTHDHSHLDDTALRVRSLQTLLTEKGYIDPAALNELIDTYENKVGPRNGAAVIARAWVDPSSRSGY